MNKKILFALWGVMFALCAGLGFIEEPAGALGALMTVLALLSFVPPVLLLWQARKTGDRHCAALVRNLAAAWLVVALALLVANFLSVLGGEVLGRVLYILLVIAASPMVCGQSWIMTLFCWACLLFAGNHILKKMKTRT